ncbi:general substrate transporter, partial [Mycena capillaripes]
GDVSQGDIADLIGRCSIITMGCSIFAIGCVLEIGPQDLLALFVIGRLVASLGVDFISAVRIRYMVRGLVRGARVSAYQFCITIGILIANYRAFGTPNGLGNSSYCIPIGIQLCGLFLLPESRRFWVRKGDIYKATVALATVRGQPRDSAFVHHELAEMIANLEFEKAHIPHIGYVGGGLACFKGSLKHPPK